MIILVEDEIEVTFGITATGDYGNYVIAVCKVGIEANYEVKFKWNKKGNQKLDKRIQELQEPGGAKQG